jgi:hypothetical protein
MTALRPGDLIRIRADAQPALDGTDRDLLIKAQAPEPVPQSDPTLGTRAAAK